MAGIPADDINYFVEEEGLVGSIIFDIGVASRGIPINELLVGPTGSGKTSTLTYIFAILERFKKEEPEKYSFEGLMHTANELFEVEEEEETNDLPIQKWVRTSGEELHYLLIDDAKLTQIKKIMSDFVRTKLKLFAVSPLDYQEISGSLAASPKVLFLRPFDLIATKQMLEKRVRRAIVDNRFEVSIGDLFEEAALKVLVRYCMGVPGLILKCASKSLHILLEIYGEKPAEALKRGRVTEEMAEKACKAYKCYQVYKHFDHIGRIKKEVLEKVAWQGMSPTEVSSLLRKDRTTVSRHLNELKDLGLVEHKLRGRESIYEATAPVKVRFEIACLPKEVWRLATA